MTDAFILTTENDGIATLTLNRPEKRNALHGPLLDAFLSALKQFANDHSRVLIINGEGDNFCAGGDISWMQKMAAASEEENNQDAELLADVLYALYVFPKPTLVLAQGAALGGGLGVLAAADIAVASKEAVFGLPEVRVGVTPSIISPYVISAMGERAAHFYFLTGERFGAADAYHMGLIHAVTEKEALMSKGIMIAKTILQNSPKALSAAKQLIHRVSREKIMPGLVKKTAKHLAELRRTPEAQEGLRAFIEKRSPNWKQ